LRAPRARARGPRGRPAAVAHGPGQEGARRPHVRPRRRPGRRDRHRRRPGGRPRRAGGRAVNPTSPVADLVPLQVAPRADRVRAALDEAGCDALVVTDLTNVRWLTGFTGSAGVLVVRPHDLVLVTDGRYQEQAADQLAAAGVTAEIEITRDTDARLATVLDGQARLGLEADHVTWDTQQRWAEALPATLVPTVGLLLGLRAVKDDGEVDRLQRAAEIADAALADVRHLLSERPTERELARALES